jgi:hypothetical protein
MEAPNWEKSHVIPKKSALATPGFTRQALGIRVGRGSSTAAVEVTEGVDIDPPSGLSAEAM